MNLEQINEILSFVVFSYNDIQLTVAKIIQVPLMSFPAQQVSGANRPI